MGCLGARTGIHCELSRQPLAKAISMLQLQAVPGNIFLVELELKQLKALKVFFFIAL